MRISDWSSDVCSSDLFRRRRLRRRGSGLSWLDPDLFRPAFRRRHRRALLHQFRADALRRRDTDRPPAGRGEDRCLCVDRTGLLMAGDVPFDAEGEASVAPKPWPRRLASWAGPALLELVALAALFLIWLNSDAGRPFCVPQVEKISVEQREK